MNRILKVVGGPLKGAEIALVSGTKVKVGSGDGCDVLVSDPSLGDVAFELEVAEDEVSIITPDGATKTLLDYEAHQFGASAFAIGAAEGAWPEVVWPEKSEERGAKSEEGSAKGGEVPSGEVPPKEWPKDARPETEDSKGAKGETGGKKRHVLRLMSLVLLMAAVVLALFACYWLRFRKTCCGEQSAVTVASQATLADVAEKYGVFVVETNGQVVLRGNLKTRAERLEATAAAFQMRPGIELELTDDESLEEAASALVSMIASDGLKVEAATNRVVVLSGAVETSAELQEVLIAMARDIPWLADVDCVRVANGQEESVPEVVRPQVVATALPTGSVEVVRQTVGRRPAQVKGKGSRPSPAVAPLRLPMCGILTVPYPCIILKNGNRVFEGGEFGGYMVEKIDATAVTLRDGKRTFEWKP